MPNSARHGRIGELAARYPAIDVLTDAASHALLPTIYADSLIEGHPVVFVNDALLAMTGCTRDAVLGQPLMQVFGDRLDASTFSSLQSALIQGHSGLWRMRLPHEQGSALPAVVYLSCVCDPLGRLVAHCVNIVDLASLDRVMSEHGSISPRICDKAPGFVAISRGENHVFEYTNASYRDFVKRTDLIGKTVAEALPEIVGEGYLTLLDEVYRTGVSFRGADLPISIRDPATGSLEQRWIDVLYQPVRDDSGAITGLFCEGYDVTGLHEMNAVVAELEMKMIHVSRVNAMGTMAATLAHELNQPLTAISNYLAGVSPDRGHAPDVDRLTAALDGIREASERASGIIGHLRQLTKHRKPNREPFNLMEATEECVRLVKSSCRSEIAFDNRVAHDVIMTADRVKIQQVLINLLQNACEAMTDCDHALVAIAAIADDHGLTVCVTDTGPGVSPEAIETMFSWTTSSKDNGMGIGLSICRTIVELYRGSIWLEKTGPDGAEFRFCVPWQPRPAGAAGSQAAARR